MIHAIHHSGKILKRSSLVFIALLLTIASSTVAFPQPAKALSGSEFNPGFIISDSAFYNPYTMSQQAIQEWLNAQISTCDTGGTKVSTHWYAEQNRYYSRAEWGALNGNPAPYTCLKDYQVSVGAVAADGLCQGIPAGTKSAALIIAEVAMSCGVNPQVLLVLLQKEQGLVTDDWPWADQYTAATGYACPDTAACNPIYAGLFNQLHWGAWQYQYYRTHSTEFNFRSGRTQYVPYNPNASCGGSYVFIQNQATAGLYNYTPYQPNASAINNLYGSGDSCGAYGNRNFWRMYSNWFGNPTAACQSDPSSKEVQRLYDPSKYKHYYTTDFCEIHTLTKQYGYRYEGRAFNSVAPETAGATAVYRLYNRQTTKHFYTIFQADIDHAVRYAGFTLEGPVYYMASSNTAGTAPIYRLYNPKTFMHMWTANPGDIDIATKQAGYQLEGVAFYAN